MATTASFGDNNSGLQVGHNYGLIHTEIHLPAGERLETPPLPFSNVPFRPDPDFVEPGDLLDQLQTKLSRPAAWIALAGLGGVGKSQLAIEYAHRLRNRSPETWVFWIHASNQARFTQSIRDLVDQLKIPGRKDPTANVCKLLHDRLSDVREGKWLVLHDNVDDVEFLLEAPSDGHDRPLIRYVPATEHGCVLITTRRRHAATALVDRNDVVDVQPMSEQEACKLLEHKVGRQEDNQAVRNLVAELEYFPLAIIQAGAYIRIREVRYSVQQYLDDFRRNDQSRSRLLSFEDHALRRDWEAKHSVLRTWEISFEYISKSRRSAADLLSVISFYDRQGIPDVLLRPQSPGESSDNDDFEQDILTLRDFSFIESSSSADSISMHRLVQLATQTWLDSHDQHQKFEEQSIARLCWIFPNGEPKNWDIIQKLFAHARKLADVEPRGKYAALKRARILYHAAWYSWRRGQGEDAELLSIVAARAYESHLGPRHDETLNSKRMMTYAYLDQGQWTTAHTLAQEIVEASSHLKEDDLRRILAANTLAETFGNLGQYRKAAEMHEQCWMMRKKKLGKDHPETLVSMSNMASYLYELGDYKKAVETEEECWMMMKARQGEDDIGTIASLSNLAVFYNWLGESAKSAELQERCWKMRERKLGPNHPHTLVSIQRYADAMALQGHYDVAIEVLGDCVEASNRVLGEAHQHAMWRVQELDKLESRRRQGDKGPAAPSEEARPGAQPGAEAGVQLEAQTTARSVTRLRDKFRRLRV